jgi:hypothetical protein
MNKDQERRLEELKGPWCSAVFIREFYGLDLQQDRDVLGRFRAWSKRFWRGDVVKQSGGAYHRHALESFLQIGELLPRKWAAIELGMDQDSFDKTLEALATESLLPPGVAQDPLVAKGLVRDIHRLFPALARTAFTTHSAYCGRLHAAITNDLGVTVTPLHCVTSEELKEDPPEYASDFDAITLEPVGTKYQVWLDFGKPINLKPDCCSLKLFAAEEAVLSHYVMRGDEPEEIPDGLRSRAG